MKERRGIPRTYEKQCPYEDCKSADVEEVGPSGWAASIEPGSKVPESRGWNYHCRACDRHFIFIRRTK